MIAYCYYPYLLQRHFCFLFVTIISISIVASQETLRGLDAGT